MGFLKSTFTILGVDIVPGGGRGGGGGGGGEGGRGGLGGGGVWGCGG